MQTHLVSTIGLSIVFVVSINLLILNKLILKRVTTDSFWIIDRGGGELSNSDICDIVGVTSAIYETILMVEELLKDNFSFSIFINCFRFFGSMMKSLILNLFNIYILCFKFVILLYKKFLFILSIFFKKKVF